VVIGVMTMFAVVFTIQHDKETRRKDYKKQIKPIIDLSFEQNGEDDSTIKISDIIDTTHTLDLIIKNSSNNILRDFKPVSLNRTNLLAGNEDQISTERLHDENFEVFGSRYKLSGGESFRIPIYIEEFNSVNSSNRLSRVQKITIVATYCDNEKTEYKANISISQ
jgi:hypothetical protein